MSHRLKIYICNSNRRVWLDYAFQHAEPEDPPGPDPYDDSHWRTVEDGKIALYENVENPAWDANALSSGPFDITRQPLSLGQAIDRLIELYPAVMWWDAGGVPDVEISVW